MLPYATPSKPHSIVLSHSFNTPFSKRGDPFAFYLMKCLIKCLRIPGDEWGAECHEPDKVQILPTAKRRTIVHLKMCDNWWRLGGDSQEVLLPPLQDNLRILIAAKVARVLRADPYQMYSSFRSGLSSVHAGLLSWREWASRSKDLLAQLEISSLRHKTSDLEFKGISSLKVSLVLHKFSNHLRTHSDWRLRRRFYHPFARISLVNN